MPIHEYHCADCDQQVDLFFRHYSDVENTEKICPICGGHNLQKLIGQVAVLSSAPDRNRVAPRDSKQETPRDLARIMTEASRKARHSFGDEFQEVAHRLEKGEHPKRIERSLRKRAGQSSGNTH